MPTRTYSSFVGFFYNLNLIVGSGFLSIPYVLVESGLASGLVTLLVIAFFSGLTARWILETMYRGDMVVRRQSGGYKDASPMSGSHQQLPVKLEVGQLCDIFVGRWARFTYDISNFTYGAIALWAYGTLAGSAWASKIPFSSTTLGQCDNPDFHHHSHPLDNACWNSYALCVLFFACIVVPLSCVEISEQIVIQLSLGVLRIVMIVSMSIYALVGEINDPKCSETKIMFPLTNHTKNVTLDECKEVWTSFSFDGWVLVFPIVTYALFLHLGIPTLTQPIRDKKNLGKMMTVLFLACTFLYALIGVSVGVRFKDNVQETCTLTWNNSTKPGYSTINRAYSYLVVLYPSIDICSAYPLMATILSNILVSDYELVTKKQPTKSMRVVSRFLIATTPLIGSLYISNLVQVTTYTGVFGCISTYMFPALIQFMSRRKIRSENFQPIIETADYGPLIPRSNSIQDVHKDTPYTSVFSGDVMVFIVAAFGVWATTATFVSWDVDR